MNNLLQPRNKALQIYGSDNGVTVAGDIRIYSRNLTAGEHKRVISGVIRRIPKLFKGLPFTDFGIDNIIIRKLRRK